LDVDQALLEHVGRQVSARDPGRWQHMLRPVSTADRRAQRALREDVKAAKEALSRHPQTEVPLPEPFTDVLVTRAELEALIRPSLLRSVELLAGTIRSTGMTPDQLVGIYLVGGSSRIPLVATLIAEQLRIVATNLDQPETAVALGAHHVAREAVSQRTDGAPPVVEERTSHIPSPPRPAPQPVPQLAPHPVPQPPRPAYTPPPPQPYYQHQAPKPNRTPLVVGLVVVLVLAIGGVLLLVLNGDDNQPVANPKSLTLDSDCADLLSEAEASEALGEPTARADSDTIEGCNFSTDNADYKDNRSFRLAIQSTDGAGDTQTEFEGFPAARTEKTGECVLVVKVSDEPVHLLVQLIGPEDDQCTTAEKIMSTALGNIPS
jgi:hypothetical protein